MADRGADTRDADTADKAAAGGGLLRGLLALTVGAALCLVVAELFLNKFMPFADPYAAYKTIKKGGSYIPSSYEPHYSTKLRIEDGLPTLKGTIQFTMNNMGFRGDPLVQPKPANEYRIFMIGGSTTIQMPNDDATVTSRVLQEELARKLGPTRVVKVYNAGKVGDRSYDHIAMLVHRLVYLQPDMVIVLQGCNDLTAGMSGADYLHYIEPRQVHYSRADLAKFLLS